MRRLLYGAMVASVATLAGSTLLAESAGVEILWLGQSAMRITTPGGKVIMIDPFITQDPKTPPG